MMQFIVSTNADRADAKTRKLIRSEARRVKNKREAKRACANVQQRQHQRKRSIELRRKVSWSDVLDVYTPLPTIAPRVGTDLSFIEFADEIELTVALNMVKAAPMARKIIYPLLSAIGLLADDIDRLCPLRTDVAALHITAFAMEALVDRYLRHQPDHYTNPAAALHLQKGLQILRERFCAEVNDDQISDSTMNVVVKLASSAHLDGDRETSQQHMRGLRGMVDLRGGFDLIDNKALIHEMLRNDIAIALLNGTEPAFYSKETDLSKHYPESVYSRLDRSKIAALEDTGLPPQIDHRLSEAWRRMRYFCMLVNLGLQTQRRIRFEMIHYTMILVMYPLLHMTDFARPSINESVRLGLLTFAYHALVQWQEIKPASCNALTTYRSHICSKFVLEQLPPRISLWLLVVGALSLYNICDEQWLQNEIADTSRELALDSWKDVHEVLKSVMWIPLLDEQAGKEIYQLVK